ncbi:unnamed protein product [Rhizoctonia solani]|uniref:Transmembrane protein n=1 Tax=Rhizoctonia solani TaxID=456999 RepID=A0A8H3E8H4_9AGAM|nr:unnamed protein product [Rhizoctonia solani]
MALPVFQLLIYLVAWSSGVAGIEWDTSNSDPSVYDLELIQPRGVYSIGITPNISWPDRWTRKYAIQIPRNGDHFIQVALGSDVWPGVYYWRTLSENQTSPVSNTFLISSSSGRTNPTTISSFVPVTATRDIVQTSDGLLVTHKSSEIYSSAVIYTTIIVVYDDGKAAPLAKVPMIIGITLALLFLITLPIILWLVLRYRRRPSHPSTKDKPTPIDLEEIHNSSVLDLMPSRGSAGGSTPILAASTRNATRQVWAIVDGEKRLVNISQDPPQLTAPMVDSDPFADPSTLKSPRRILIPANPSIFGNDSPSGSINPNDPLLSRANTVTTSFSATFSRGAPSIDAHTGPTQNREALTDKMPTQTRQRIYSENYALSEEDITSRIIVPGRAVDMGSLGRDHVPDVDEHGLLPPDYFQATQPTSSQQSSQAGPSAR